MIKADSLVSLKQQIKRVKNKFTEDYDNDVDRCTWKKSAKFRKVAMTLMQKI